MEPCLDYTFRVIPTKDSIPSCEFNNSKIYPNLYTFITPQEHVYLVYPKGIEPFPTPVNFIGGKNGVRTHTPF